MRNPSDTCGVEVAMEIVAGKWKRMILCALEQRPHRFGELRRALPGVSQKVLAQQLRELEADGVVHRDAHDEVPPRVDYSLTAVGEALLEALSPLGAWGAERIEQRALAAAG